MALYSGRAPRSSQKSTYMSYVHAGTSFFFPSQLSLHNLFQRLAARDGTFSLAGFKRLARPYKHKTKKGVGGETFKKESLFASIWPERNGLPSGITITNRFGSTGNLIYSYMLVRVTFGGESWWLYMVRLALASTRALHKGLIEENRNPFSTTPLALPFPPPPQPTTHLHTSHYPPYPLISKR